MIRFLPSQPIAGSDYLNTPCRTLYQAQTDIAHAKGSRAEAAFKAGKISLNTALLAIDASEPLGSSYLAWEGAEI